MIVMTLPDPATDPTGYVLTVADLREQRAKAATPGPYVARTAEDGFEIAAGPLAAVWLYVGDDEHDRLDTEHIAAEANPEHTLAEVALWRGIAERHRAEFHNGKAQCWEHSPPVKLTDCPDLLAIVAAAKAYAEPTA